MHQTSIQKLAGCEQQSKAAFWVLKLKQEYLDGWITELY
jgi:hypothetical protein